MIKPHPTHSMKPVGKDPWPEECKRCGVRNEQLDIRLARPCPHANANGDNKVERHEIKELRAA